MSSAAFQAAADADVVGPGASEAAISFHYDIGNEFYRQWLDEHMVYSCALWKGDEDLATAQVNKLDWHLDHVGLQPGQRLLDIGCGWGALIARAVERGALHAVGLTLSQAQVEWIGGRQLPHVDARLENWAEHMVSSPYDSIVSIGAFEHFARLDATRTQKLDGYRRFFEFCHRSLKPGGRLSLQTISYENTDRSDFPPFFAEHIFPESDLPHLDEIAHAIRGLFEIELLRNDRQDYARTMRCWLSTLRARMREAVAVVGSETYEHYVKYLGMMIIAFHIGNLNLTRVAMRRIEPRQA